MKNIYYSAMVFTVLFMFSCKHKPKPMQEQNNQKKTVYSAMSSIEKKEFKNKIIAELRADTNFIIVNKLLISEITNYNQSKSLVNSTKEKMELLIKMTSILKKHPELSQLDKSTRKEVIKAAAN